MKRTIILVTLCLVITANAKHTTPFGVVLEAGISSFAYDFAEVPNPTAKVKFGMGLGVSHEFPILNWLMLRSEVLWEFYQGGGEQTFEIHYYDESEYEVQKDSLYGEFSNSIGCFTLSPSLKVLPPAKEGHPYIEVGPKLMVVIYSNENIEYNAIYPDTIAFINQSESISGLDNLFYGLNLGAGADIMSGAYGTVTVGLRFTYWFKSPEYTFSLNKFVRTIPNAVTHEPSDYTVSFKPIAVKVLFAYKF